MTPLDSTKTLTDAEELIDDVERLEYQLFADRHPSNTVVVTRSVLRRVLDRVREQMKRESA